MLATDLAPLMADLSIAKKLLALDNFEPAPKMTDLAQLLPPVPQSGAGRLLKLILVVESQFRALLLVDDFDVTKKH